MREVGKKELIVSSTKKLILERGYNNISVEDITNEAGIAKGSFYTYFKSKNLVIDYILEEMIEKLGRKISIDKRMSLTNSVRRIVSARLKLDDEELKENLLLVNLFRNAALLDSNTLELLKRIESLLVDTMEEIILSYTKSVRVKQEEARFYSKILNNMISSYKTFTLFFSEKDNQFIKNIEEVKRKYQTEEFERNMEILSESILKILIY